MSLIKNEKRIFSRSFLKKIEKDLVKMVEEIIQEYKKVINEPLGYTTVREFILTLEGWKENFKGFSEINKTEIRITIYCDLLRLLDEFNRLLNCNNEYVLIDGKRFDNYSFTSPSRDLLDAVICWIQSRDYSKRLPKEYLPSEVNEFLLGYSEAIIMMDVKKYEGAKRVKDKLMELSNNYSESIIEARCELMKAME